MKHPKVLLVLLGLMVALSAYSQTDFRPGYYITHDFDTIHGEIDYRRDQRNMKECVFRANKEAVSVSIGPDKISSYRFQQGKYYISIWLKINSEKTQVFAEFLVNGIVNLFYYRDLNGDHYFLQKEDGEMFELEDEFQTFVVDGQVYTRDTKRHIGILKSAFSDCSEIQSDLDKAILSHKSLITLTSDYHGYVCDDQQCLIYEKELPSVKLGIAPVLGYGISSIQFQAYDLIENLDFESSSAPILGIQLNLNSPRFNEKLYLQFDMGIVKNYFYAYSETETEENVNYVDVHMENMYMNFSLAFKYKFLKGNVRPTIAGGALASYMLSGDVRYIHEQDSDGVVYTYSLNSIPLAVMHWGGMVQAGLDFDISEGWTCFTQFRYQVGRGSNYIDDRGEMLVSRLSSVSVLIGIYF